VLPPDPRIDGFARILPLERGLLLGLATVLLGGIMLVTRAGFEVLRTDFLFLFPRVLSALRPLEARLARFRAGAQYMVLCRKVKW
jgi:hypothetical protein